jgi:hypothetical protein
MIKNLIAALLVGALSACGGGGSDPALETGDKTLTLGNETVRFDQTGTYSLTVLSANNNITIAAGDTLANISIQGANNTLNVENSVAIASLRVTGANNSVTLANSATVAQFDIGGDNANASIGAGARVDHLLVSGSNGAIAVQGATAVVPDIRLSGSNISVRLPAGYLSQTTITNTGVNNTVN